MKTREAELAYIYLFFDLILLNLALAVIACFRVDKLAHGAHDFIIYILHANLSWIITYFIFSKKNLYLRDGFANRFKGITKRMVIFTAILGTSGFLLLPKYYSRIFLIDFLLLFYMERIAFYFVLYQYLKFLREKGIHVNNALIIGNSDTARLLHKIITNNYLLGYNFVGFLFSQNEEERKIIGQSEDLEAMFKEKKAQVIFVTQSLNEIGINNEQLLRICNRNGLRLRILPENQHLFKKSHNSEAIEHLVLINPQETPFDDMGNRIVKRLFDVGFSLLVIVTLFSWLFPIIAILIKLSSRGPVFFVQRRTGIDQHPFYCIKFRSMSLNDEADTRQATANDVRITRIGRFIRRTNIDEFPQFFNVLLGQMSVVGPRPHMLEHTKQYSELIEFYLTRHYVKPGITGWAQVNGYRGETNALWKMEKRVELDSEYIRNWTLEWDIKIIWMTVFGNKAFENAG